MLPLVSTTLRLGKRSVKQLLPICAIIVQRWISASSPPSSPSPSTAASRPPPASLHTVQSNVSTHVARLERELGRHARRPRQRRASPRRARPWSRRARRIQAELDALDADVAALHDEVAGTVRLGVHRHHGPLARARSCSRRCTRAHPKVHVVVVDATTTSLVPQLARRRARPRRRQPAGDRPRARRPSRSSTRTASLVAPDGHPLAERDARRASPTSADHELLLEPSGTAFRDELDREAAAAGVELRAKAEVDGLRLIASLAFQGFGAAIVPATAAPALARGQLAAGRRSTAWPAARSASPGAAAACSRRRPARCATRYPTSCATEGAGTRRASTRAAT